MALSLCHLHLKWLMILCAMYVAKGQFVPSPEPSPVSYQGHPVKLPTVLQERFQRLLSTRLPCDPFEVRAVDLCSLLPHISVVITQ